MQDKIERRKYARLDVPMRVDYGFSEKDKFQTVLSKDMSMGGILLLSKEKIDVGTQIEMDVYLANAGVETRQCLVPTPLKISGRIVWQDRHDKKDKGYYYTGISFSNFKDDGMERFLSFCFDQMHKMVKMPEWYMKKTG